MAVSSVFLILLTHQGSSIKSALRYIIVHLVGGLILLAGIILYYKVTGSFLFLGYVIRFITNNSYFYWLFN